jgi:hypothetical protein
MPEFPRALQRRQVGHGPKQAVIHGNRARPSLRPNFHGNENGPAHPASTQVARLLADLKLKLLVCVSASSGAPRFFLKVRTPSPRSERRLCSENATRLLVVTTNLTMGSPLNNSTRSVHGTALQQAVVAHRIVRRRGFHVFCTIGSRKAPLSFLSGDTSPSCCICPPSPPNWLRFIRGPCHINGTIVAYFAVLRVLTALGIWMQVVVARFR